ncbi:MAG: radical SAM/SPASM domain-containing protein [Planctomycetota bacterium]|nr:MAG: radical SAM/SPASM domain-containing protein [Planctomycetota bacterium]
MVSLQPDFDFGQSPLMFYYEVTQACDLSCRHCRASAQPLADPRELTHEQSCALLDQLAAFPQPPVVVLTGGDPLKRRDLLELIRHGRSLNLQLALTPSATPLATRGALAACQAAGVSCLGVSLDGADAATHDAFRGWQGSFDRTLQMLDDARQLKLPVQVNTTITRRNWRQIDAMAALFAQREIMMWSVFFLTPVGRGLLEERISPLEYEDVFEQLYRHSRRQNYGIKTTEAPHYRRFVIERDGDPLANPVAPHRRPSRPRRTPLGVGDGKGIMFVGHTGEIYPAGFLPLECGRFPPDSVIDVYQRHPTFVALRRPDGFGGKCGLCEYRHICGGSRARAYALTGDPLAEEPDCAYIPSGAAPA